MIDKHRFNVVRDYKFAEEDGKIMHKKELIGSVLVIPSRKTGEKNEYILRGNVACDKVTHPVFNLQYYVVEEMI